MNNKEIYRLLFQPKTIAIIGASSNPLKPGGRVFKNIKENGYTGELWPVNPKAQEVMGLPAFPGIAELPAAPELALISIPAPGVQGALEALAEKGTKAVIILTAGFGEKGEEGKALERKFLEIAKQNDMTLIGPNCSGFLTPVYAGKFAGIIPQLVPGSIDFVSGSGATVDYVMEQAVVRGLKFSHVVNLGNSIQLGVEDILELMDESHNSENSKIILLYMEAVIKPQKLLKHVRSLADKGCIFIGIKSGTTDAGAKAAASHTGAMATSDHAVQALFDKAGIIRVNSKMDLIETTCALVSIKKLPKGNRACIITDAGGPGVMLTDELNRLGICLPTFSQNAFEKLQDLLPPQASLENPIDCLPSRNAEQIKEIFKILGEEESSNLDFAFFVSGNSGMSDNWEIYKEIINSKKSCPIPILPIFSSATTCADLLEKTKEKHTLYFDDEVSVGRAMGRLVNRPIVHSPGSTPNNYDQSGIEKALKGHHEALTPTVVEVILRSAGFNLPPQAEILLESEMSKACQNIGFPVVMKVVGPLHKSDVGGVKVGINTQSEADNAWQELMKIPDAKGVLIQKMISGVEVILGASREADFGHLVMFGLGGIYTEVLKDVQFSLAPLSLSEAEKMIRGIRSFPILEGVRGETGVSLEILADYLVRLSLLVNDFPQIREIDLNPVKGSGEHLYAVDTRILVD
jgi:acyl-CoA synthetase (NDP forming)